jgi:hypothetical protein
MSRFGFAPVARREANGVNASKVAGPLQGNYQLLNFVELDGVSRKPCHVVR